MEHLVRVRNEQDRQTLAWLRRQVGDAAIAAAVEHCSHDGKPWLSTVCRSLRVTPPESFSAPRHGPSTVAEQSLAAIRAILSGRTTATNAGSW